MESILKDERFAHIGTDVRFRSVPKAERKVKIDKRFQSMFTEKNFKVKYSVDKRGRKQNFTTNENLKKYYDLSSSSSEDEAQSEKSVKSKEKSKNKIIESDEDVKVGRQENKFDVDYARGEGGIESSSSDEESSSEDEERGDGSVELVHPWGELDSEATRTDDVTSRFAVCNMDWDRITAHDLYVMLNSFAPSGGIVRSVKVFLSDYGRERLREEEISGPMELRSNKNHDSGDESSTSEGQQEGDKYHMEKLRQYQLNRLKYYYAVVECDCVSTACKIYDECDGLEYESSAAKLDLRYIPEDMTFDLEAHNTADGTGDVGGYRPKNFTTTALQQAKVKLTWDETNPDRLHVIQRAFNKDDQESMDLGIYLASSDSDSGDEKRDTRQKRLPVGKNESDEGESSENEGGILKYKTLLREIEESEKKKDDNDVHLEITWGMGLKEKAESLIKDKMNKKEITPWQQYIIQKKEKKRQKREEKKEKTQKGNEDETPYSDDEIPSDVDLNDPFFKQDIREVAGNQNTAKNAKKQEILIENEEDEQKKAELELLLMDGDDSKHHFSLKKLLKEDKKKKKKSANDNKDGFQINVEDARFSAIFNSHAYNIDPSESNFKRTKGMEMLIKEKQKRQMETGGDEDDQPVIKKEKLLRTQEEIKSSKSEVSAPSRCDKVAELSQLIKSVKSKALNFLTKKKKTIEFVAK